MLAVGHKEAPRGAWRARPAAAWPRDPGRAQPHDNPPPRSPRPASSPPSHPSPPKVIYDLLVKASGPLELREDPDQGVCVAGLKRIQARLGGAWRREFRGARGL
jgi:hypothetical protein